MVSGDPTMLGWRSQMTLALLVGALLLLVTSCGQRVSSLATTSEGPSASPNPEPSTPVQPSPTVSPEPSAPTSLPNCQPPNKIDEKQATPPDGLEVTLTLAKVNYSLGEPIEMTVRIENTSDRSVTYSQEDGQDNDFFVIYDGNYIWSYFFDDAFTLMAEEHTLQPGQAQERTGVWEQKVCPTDGSGVNAPPGDYTAQALWKGPVVGWYSNRVEFTVSPEGTGKQEAAKSGSVSDQSGWR